MSGLITGGGSNSSNSSRSTNDPFTLGINEERYRQLQDFVRGPGGMADITSRAPALAAPSAGEMRFLDMLTAMPGQPLMRGEERRGLGTLRGAVQEPDDAVRYASDIFNRIAAPEITNRMTAMGQGRSGAVGEALARAGAEMALPIASGALDRRFTGLTNLGNTMFGAGNMLEGRNMDRIMTALQAAGTPRQAQYEAVIQQPMNVLLQMLTGIPTLAPTTASRGRSESWQFGLCWVADALYGEGSIEARLARYWVSKGWQGKAADAFRAVYRRVGPALAAVVRRSAVVQSLVQPMFDRFVARGLVHALRERMAV